MTATAQPRWRWFVPALLLSTASLELALAWIYPGFLTGDDLSPEHDGASRAYGR